MALMLTSRGLLGRIHDRVERGGPERTAVVLGTAAGVGVIAGRMRDPKTVPVVALGAGVVANCFGLSGLGDGAMGAGATLIGYRLMARAEAKKALAAAPPAPSTAAPKKFFRTKKG